MTQRAMSPMTRCIVTVMLLLASQPAAAFDLQGHRGARGLAPENTLPAFAKALAIGVHTLELDVAITRDGQIVISHDPALNPDLTRGPDGQYLATRGPLISQLSLHELRRYDVGRIKPGTHYAGLYPEQQAIDGTRVPLLTELFALLKKAGNSQVRLDIETKINPMASHETLAPELFARALIRTLRDAGMASRTTIQSFDWRSLQVVQKEAPEILTAYLSAQQKFLDNIGADQAAPSPWTAGFQYQDHGSVPKMVKAAGGRVWSVFHGDLDADKLREAKALGLTVLVWTVNHPALISKLMDLGVDGLISDRPDLVRAEMARRGLPLPAATPVDP